MVCWEVVKSLSNSIQDLHNHQDIIRILALKERIPTLTKLSNGQDHHNQPSKEARGGKLPVSSQDF